MAVHVPQIEREVCEKVMFGLGRARRFRQDSAVLRDVWLWFAEDLADSRRTAGKLPALRVATLRQTPWQLALPRREVVGLRREGLERVGRERAADRDRIFRPRDGEFSKYRDEVSCFVLSR